MKNLTVDTPVIQKDGKILPLSDSAESVGGLEFRVNEGKPQVRVKGTEEWKDFDEGVTLSPSVHTITLKRGPNNWPFVSENALGYIVFVQFTTSEPAQSRRGVWYVDEKTHASTKLDGGGTIASVNVGYNVIEKGVDTAMYALFIPLEKKEN